MHPKSIVFAVFAVFAMLVVFASLLLSLLTKSGTHTDKNAEAFTESQKLPSQDVYCIMPTGKSARRIAFAKIAVHNFQQQTYKHKYLIIVNDNNLSVLEADKIYDNIIEIPCEEMTLGAKKNLAISMIPYQSIWTCWDDDDWRADDYLEIMVNRLHKDPQKKFLMYRNRLEHNMLTDFTWRLTIKNGTYIFFCTKLFNKNLLYDDLDNKEDVGIKKYLLQNTKDVVLYDNPRFDVYIRFSHGENTSSFVDSEKQDLKMNTKFVNDSYASIEEQRYVSHIKNLYYYKYGSLPQV